MCIGPELSLEFNVLAAVVLKSHLWLCYMRNGIKVCHDFLSNQALENSRLERSGCTAVILLSLYFPINDYCAKNSLGFYKLLT